MAVWLIKLPYVDGYLLPFEAVTASERSLRLCPILKSFAAQCKIKGRKHRLDLIDVLALKSKKF